MKILIEKIFVAILIGFIAGIFALILFSIADTLIKNT